MYVQVCGPIVLGSVWLLLEYGFVQIEQRRVSHHSQTSSGVLERLGMLGFFSRLRHTSVGRTAPALLREIPPSIAANLGCGGGRCPTVTFNLG